MRANKPKVERNQEAMMAQALEMTVIIDLRLYKVATRRANLLACANPHRQR